MGFSREYPKDYSAHFDFSLTSANEGKKGAIVLGEKLLAASYEENIVFTLYSDKYRIDDSGYENVSYNKTLKDLQETRVLCDILAITFSCHKNIENEYQSYWNKKTIVFILSFSFNRTQLKKRIEQLKKDLFNQDENEIEKNNTFYCQKYNAAIIFFSQSSNFKLVYDWILSFVRSHEKVLSELPLNYNVWSSRISVSEKYLTIWYSDMPDTFVFSEHDIADLENVDYATGLLIAISIKISEHYEKHPTYSFKWKIEHSLNNSYKNEVLFKLRKKPENLPKQSW